MLIREIKEVLNIRRTIFKRLNTVLVSLSPKLIYRFNTLLSKSQQGFVVNIEDHASNLKQLLVRLPSHFTTQSVTDGDSLPCGEEQSV